MKMKTHVLNLHIYLFLTKLLEKVHAESILLNLTSTVKVDYLNPDLNTRALGIEDLANLSRGLGTEIENLLPIGSNVAFNTYLDFGS